jgi:protein-disulfide isomerase
MSLEDIDDAPMSPSTQALYVLAMAVLVGSLLLAGSVWFSYQKITDTLEGKTLGGVPTQGDIDAKNDTNLKNPSDSDNDNSGSGYQKDTANVFDVDSRPYRGNKNAEITMIEFSDFECPFCTRAQPTVEKILQEYDGKIKHVYAHLPLSFHPNAEKAAEASECAADQGKFWEYHNLLFEGNGLEISNLKSYAKDLGLDTAKFDSCLDSGEKGALVTAHMQEAMAREASGTPTFFLNNVKLVGAQPYEVFQTQIDSILSGNPPVLPEEPQEQPADNPIKTVDITSRPFKGDADASIVVVEFSEFQCPFCTRAQPTIEQLLEDYDGKLKTVHMNFIVHESAKLASVAAECAEDQGKYYEMHDLIFETSKTDEAGLKELAGQLGLDMDEFSACLGAGKDDVLAIQQAAGSSNGVRGTPSFVIGKEIDGKVIGTLIVGAQPIDQFKQILEPLISASDEPEEPMQEQDDEGSQAQIANPASVFCVDNGGRLEIRNTDLGQMGFCIFSDGSECEEWAYYRDECTPGGTLIPSDGTIQEKLDAEGQQDDAGGDGGLTAEPSADPDPRFYD